MSKVGCLDRPSGGRSPALRSVFSTPCLFCDFGTFVLSTNVERNRQRSNRKSVLVAQVHAHSGWSPKTAQGVPLGYPLCVFAPTPSPVGSGVVNALFTRRDPMHRRGRGLNASPPRLIGCPNRFQRGRLPVRLAEWVRGDEYLRQNKNYIKVLRGLGCFFKSTPSVLPYSYKQQFIFLIPPPSPPQTARPA